jgi:hypothetical protein
MAEYNLHELLQLAGVHDSDKKAVAWLEAAIAGANHNYQAAQTRPHARDHNEWLAEIERAAKKLNKTLERLRKRHTAYRGFWHSSAFGPVFSDRFEIKEVRETIDKIIRAANEAKDPRKGRGRQTGKQHVVDLALGFFERFSPHNPSGTTTGKFSKFARKFYSAATGRDPETDGLDRQIRHAVGRKGSTKRSLKN